MPTPFFTVFTPTYNRSHTLHRVYSSLLAQTYHNFEWLIVDDGSVDRTVDLVQTWQQEERISIRYIYQSNGGKHIAFNRGVCEAQGELFLAFDSDDTCEPNTLERFRERWLAIPEEVRGGFSGITCLCRNEMGELIGGSLPYDTLDGHPYEVMSRYRRRGEMWGFHRTEILRDFPFPEYPGERFVPEGLVWNRIGRCYKIRFINEALRCYIDTPASLSASMTNIRRQSPRATYLYYNEYLDLPTRFFDRIRAASNLWRFVFLTKVVEGRLRATILKHPILMSAAFLPGMLIALRDSWQLNADCG